MADSSATAGRLVHRAQVLSSLAALVVALVGIAVLLGWLFDLRLLKSVFPHLASMKANLALAFIVAGASLILCRRGTAPVAIAGGAFVLALGGATLIQDLAGLDLGIDELLVPDPGEFETARGGRMSPASSWNLFLLGTAIVLVTRPAGALVAQLLGLVAASVALVALLGYLLGVSALYGVRPFTSMALHTTLTFLLLTFALLFRRPSEGIAAVLLSSTSGGRLARRLLPLAFIVPLFTGWLQLTGQRAGLYGPAFGTALFTAVNIIVFAILIGWNATIVRRREIERIRAHKLLRERDHAVHQSELRKSAILESAIDCIITMDREGRIIEFNPAAERTFGYRREEIIGRQAGDTIVPPDLRDGHRAGMKRFLETGESEIIGRRVEMRGLRADGTDFPIELAVVRIDDDGVPLFTAYLRDITERKEADRALRQGEARFRNLADAMPQIVWTAGPDGRINYFNGRWQEYTGLSQDGSLEIESAMHPDDVVSARSAWSASVSSGEPFQTEYRLKHRESGEYHWHLARALPLRDDSGSITCWYGTCTDIDDQKGAQRQLEKQACELEQVDRRKDDLLAILGHELRNPLACIDSAVRLMRTSQRGEHAEWATGVIAENVIQLATLLNDLLDITRISRGRLTLRKRKVALASLISRAVEAARPLIEERRHEFIIALSPDSIWIEAEPTRLEQVLVTLLVNAAKHTEEGGRIQLSAEKEMDHATIKVRDSGSGIPPEMLDASFDPFTRIREEPYPAHGGLGIGLSLVRQLIEMHDGQVTAHHDGLGKGTEVVLRLPVVDRPLSGKPESRAKTPRKLPTGVRVLVVDDNVDAAAGLSAILKLCGCDVQTVYDGKSALEAARRQRPDAMLVDIGLPDINGYDVARAIRSDESYAQTLLVAVSGYGHEEARQTSREAGFDHHLPKPADMDVLLSLLAKQRTASRTRREE